MALGWLFFVKGYLKSARLNLTEFETLLSAGEMEHPMQDGHMTDPKQLRWNTYIDNYIMLWMPTIFLIRHACELILKSLSNDLYKNFQKAHDLRILQQFISQADINNNFFAGYFDKFWLICEKYYTYTFNNRILINPNGTMDSMNSLFRYPQNERKGVPFEIDTRHIDCIDITFVRGFISDVNKLEELASTLSSTIGGLAGKTEEELAEWEGMIKKYWEAKLDDGTTIIAGCKE
jgi:hypothetical protein